MTNLIQLSGVFARSPELRYAQTGLAIFTGTVAGESIITDKNGERRSIPYYHTVQVLGRFAEVLAERQYAAGDPVLVIGRLDENKYEAEGGQKRRTVRVQANTLETLNVTPELTQDAGGGVRMKGGINEVSIRGHLGQTPELHYTPSGDAVLRLNVAVNDTWTDKQGEKQERTHWLDVTLWRELAETNADLQKGDAVFVTGRFTNESWTDKDGNRRSTQKIEGRSVIRLRRGGTQNAAQSAAQSTRPATPHRDNVQPAPQGPAQAAERPSGPSALDIDQGLYDLPPYESDMPF